MQTVWQKNCEGVYKQIENRRAEVFLPSILLTAHFIFRPLNTLTKKSNSSTFI